LCSLCMMATLTITLSDDVLKALREAKAITVALGTGPAASRAAPVATSKAANGKAGPYREGSLPRSSSRGPAAGRSRSASARS